MRLICVVLAVVLGVFCARPACAEKVDLKLLYAGHPGSAREKEFVAFLGEHFSKVRTADLSKFRPDMADGVDVVLMDWDGDGFKAPHPQLPASYTRPTVTIGVAGAFISGGRRLKTGYI